MVNMGLRTPAVSFSGFVVFCGLLAPNLACADDPEEPSPITITCDGHYLTRVTIDGFQNDWEDEVGPVPRVQQLVDGDYLYDWTGPVDASFKSWCRYNRHGLYFAVVGRDNFVVEPRGERPGDLFEVSLLLLDGNELEPTRIIVPIYDNGDGLALPIDEIGAPIEGARGEVSPREDGYFLEFSLPTTALPGLEAPFEPIAFALSHLDWDYDADREHQSVVSTGVAHELDADEWGVLAFDGPRRLAAEVARELGGPLNSDVVFAEFGGAVGIDATFIIGTTIAIAGPSLGDFDWFLVDGLPSGATTRSLEAHDIDHDGAAEIFVTYDRNRWSIDAGGEVRESFTDVWRFRDGELQRTIHQLVRQELPDGQVAALSLTLRERSDRTVVRFSPNDDETTGTREAWIRVDPRSDDEYQPLLLPWDSRSRIDWDITGAGEWVVLSPE